MEAMAGGPGVVEENRPQRERAPSRALLEQHGVGELPVSRKKAKKTAKLACPKEDELYAVHMIEKERMTEAGELEYLTWWKPVSKNPEPTWEPPSSFAKCKHVIEDFHNKSKR
jgi:hypothetical protein